MATTVKLFRVITKNDPRVSRLIQETDEEYCHRLTEKVRELEAEFGILISLSLVENPKYTMGYYVGVFRK